MRVLVENLSFSYGKKLVFDNANLVVNAGDVIAIIGSNGSGKTTLLKLIGDFLKPTKGKVVIEEANSISEGFLFAGGFETPNFWNYMTGMENVQYFLGEKYNKSEIEKCFKYWNIEEVKDKKVKNYSLGMRQKLMLIVAFAAKTPILLFDEPINSLDQESIELFFGLVKKAKEDGRIVIFTTHIMYELEEKCSEIYVINDAKLTKYMHDNSRQMETFVITFRTTDDAIKAKSYLDENEIVDYKGPLLTVIERKRTISEMIRIVSRYNILTVVKKGKIYNLQSREEEESE